MARMGLALVAGGFIAAPFLFAAALRWKKGEEIDLKESPLVKEIWIESAFATPGGYAHHLGEQDAEFIAQMEEALNRSSPTTSESKDEMYRKARSHIQQQLQSSRSQVDLARVLWKTGDRVVRLRKLGTTYRFHSRETLLIDAENQMKAVIYRYPDCCTGIGNSY